jgi:hypothetical protein
MNNLIIKLKKNGFSQKVIAILEGGPVSIDLTPGELFFLSKKMPDDRVKELVYVDNMPFYGISELLEREEDCLNSEDGEHLIKRMHETAIGFSQKYETFMADENASEKEFYELLACVESIDHCIQIMEDVSNQKQIDGVIAKIRTFIPSIDDWVNVIESGKAANPSKAVLLDALAEIEAIANETNKLEDWIKLYEYCMEKTDQERRAREKINTFATPFQTWMNIHKEYPYSKTGVLALQKMQELKGSFKDWKELFEKMLDIIDMIDLERIPPKHHIHIYVNMMLETGNLDDLDFLYIMIHEHLPALEIPLLQKMMTMVDSASV